MSEFCLKWERLTIHLEMMQQKFVRKHFGFGN